MTEKEIQQARAILRDHASNSLAMRYGGGVHEAAPLTSGAIDRVTPATWRSPHTISRERFDAILSAFVDNRGYAVRVGGVKKAYVPL